MALFAVVAVFVLVASTGFAFADRDTTFAFESPTPAELETTFRWGRAFACRRVGFVWLGGCGLCG